MYVCSRVLWPSQQLWSSWPSSQLSYTVPRQGLDFLSVLPVMSTYFQMAFLQLPHKRCTCFCEEISTAWLGSKEVVEIISWPISIEFYVAGDITAQCYFYFWQKKMDRTREILPIIFTLHIYFSQMTTETASQPFLHVLNIIYSCNLWEAKLIIQIIRKRHTLLRFMFIL